MMWGRSVGANFVEGWQLRLASPALIPYAKRLAPGSVPDAARNGDVSRPPVCARLLWARQPDRRRRKHRDVLHLHLRDHPSLAPRPRAQASRRRGPPGQRRDMGVRLSVPGPVLGRETVAAALAVGARVGMAGHQVPGRQDVGARRHGRYPVLQVSARLL